MAREEISNKEKPHDLVEVTHHELPEEMKKALAEAFESEGFLVTVSYRKGDELKHTWVTQNYLKGDLLSSLRALATDIRTKEFENIDDIEGNVRVTRKSWE